MMASAVAFCLEVITTHACSVLQLCAGQANIQEFSQHMLLLLQAFACMQH